MKGKKTGGIQKGYKYSKTLAFKEACDAKGFAIVDKLIGLFENTENEFLQFQILQEMAKYVYAVPKDYGEESSDDSNNDPSNELRDVSNSLLIKFVKQNQKESTDE